jgi:hypothetical protein
MHRRSWFVLCFLHKRVLCFKMLFLQILYINNKMEEDELASNPFSQLFPTLEVAQQYRQLHAAAHPVPGTVVQHSSSTGSFLQLPILFQIL